MTGNWQGVLILLCYYLFAMLIIWYLTWKEVPKEWLRKSYHIMCTFSIIILLHGFDVWLHALLTHVLLYMTALIVLIFLAEHKLLTTLNIDRNRGTAEITIQITYIIASFAASLIFFWGILGSDGKGYAAVGFLVWGAGDAFAALVGKYHGKRSLASISSVLNPDKTVEGALSLMVVTFVTVMITVPIYYPMEVSFTDISRLVGLAMVVTLVASLSEGIAVTGEDSLTLPLSVSLATYLVMSLLGMTA